MIGDSLVRDGYYSFTYDAWGHQIVFDPNLESNTTNMLKGVFTEKYDFIPFPGKTKGLGTSRVLQSQLYKKQNVAELYLVR